MYNLLNKFKSLAFLQKIKHISKPSNSLCANDQHCDQTSKHHYSLKHIVPYNSLHTTLEVTKDKSNINILQCRQCRFEKFPY